MRLIEFLVSAAFMAGLLGGVHCAAMCGGIIAACMKGASRTKPNRWRFAFAYNTGRIASYTAAGTLAGALGQGAMQLRGGMVMQQVMMSLAGASMLLLALYLCGITSVVRRMETAGGYLWRHIQPYSRAVLPADTVPKSLALGALWGWLPCGMVYGVLLTAIASGDAAYGALVMLAFGLGTLPNVFAITFLTDGLRRFTRTSAMRLTVALIIGAVGAYALFKAAHPSAAHAEALLCQFLPSLASH